MDTADMSRREMIRLLVAASAAGVLPGAVMGGEGGAASTRSADAGHVHPPGLRMGKEEIAILVYPEFTALDALGPHYALAGMIGARVRFVAKTMEPVVCEGALAGGFCVKPHMTFADCPKELDLLLVPGGLKGTMAAIEDGETRAFVAERGGGAKLAGSVCTGSLLLGAAGLLKGRRATSHWSTLELLAEVGAKGVSERVVFDGKDRVTAAGVSAGLDLGFELVRRYRGDFYAKGMQLLGEYDPHPPFAGAGNPATADKDVVAFLNAMHAPLVEKFKESLKKAKEAGG